jgi:hypothetical protein
MRDKLLNTVKQAVIEELERTYSEYGYSEFNSAHEGYAIIKEEVEEAEVELNRIKQMFAWAWETIKINGNPNDKMDSIKKCGIYLACEAIQIAAMAEKYRSSLNKLKEEKGNGNKI